MKPIDISPLVKGGLAVIALAISLSQYGCFNKWVTAEAAKALYVSPQPDSRQLFAPSALHRHSARPENIRGQPNKGVDFDVEQAYRLDNRKGPKLPTR
jgi:hypothetical protein